jgi:hypothetical protein
VSTSVVQRVRQFAYDTFQELTVGLLSLNISAPPSYSQDYVARQYDLHTSNHNVDPDASRLEHARTLLQAVSCQLGRQ